MNLNNLSDLKEQLNNNNKDIEDVEKLLLISKRNNTIRILNEIKSRLFEVKNSLENEINNINIHAIDTYIKEDQNENKYQIVIIDKYTTEIKSKEIVIKLELNLNKIDEKNINCKFTKNSLEFSIIDEIANKKYLLKIKQLSHNILPEESYYYKEQLINDNKQFNILIFIKKENSEDAWNSINYNKYNSIDKLSYDDYINCSQTGIPVSYLKNIYVNGTEEERKKLVDKFGKEVIEVLFN